MDYLRKKRKNAFTLIELLVVISIIALLVSILMPALAKARQRAKGVVCLANQKTWGLIWAMYTDENSGKFPKSEVDGISVGWLRGTWIISLREHWNTKSEILQCPSADKLRPGTSPNDFNVPGGAKYSYRMGTTPGLDNKHVEVCSYAPNNWTYDDRGGVQGRDGSKLWRNVDNHKMSNNIPIFGDCMWRGGGPDSDIPAKIEPPIEASDPSGPWPTPRTEFSYGQGMKHFAIDRHNGAINLTFMDMSARPVSIKELWKLKWNKKFDIRNEFATGSTPWSTWVEKTSR